MKIAVSGQCEENLLIFIHTLVCVCVEQVGIV